MKTIAIDFGASYLRFAVVENGRILRRVVQPTPSTAAGIASAFRHSFKVLHLSGVSKKTPVGIASIGPFIRDGVIVATNVGGLRINLIKIVEKFHDGKITLLNDCNAAALAEKAFSPWRTVDNLVYVSISTGIGGGAVVDGHLLIGKDGNAAEVGHMVVDYQSDVKCGCGGLGHWEAFCSGTGLPKLAQKLTGRKVWTDSRQIFEAAARRDRRALAVLSKMAEFNAVGFSNLMNVYDPEVIVVGGGVALNNPRETVGGASRLLDRYSMLRCRIALTSLGHDGPLLGAAAAAAWENEG
ncbi:MAG: ROK family protein [Candidatus Caldarchaeum sp.]|nr:ROK family protein [Candidatus Caldarchaeum sp.]MCS7138382.1 ROK family protein [Candidatus Caldarchaeum sp.]MDW7978903.1 ROK family protein [Candidatus Caldarchaeum sp.]MDW8359851.1 ROK family protein [Candidatus Caldarchaeum sp.]